MTASTTQAKGKAPRRAAAKPKRSGAQKRENRTGWAFMAPFAVLFTFVFILPIIWAIYSSFFRQSPRAVAHTAVASWSINS